MKTFSEVYKGLNDAQKSAVDLIDGPMMVIAGPGTGKTQLLSARVASVLDKTDTLPQNILCLTFTESGARNMRERLTSFIGKSAYDVNINTYHGFGTELIRHYPEYIDGISLERPIDDIGKRQILADIVDKLPYSSPLKSQRYTIKDLTTTISELKRALLSPDDIKKLAKENQKQITDISAHTKQIFADMKTMPRSYDKAIGYFTKMHGGLKSYDSGLAYDAREELDEALATAETDNSTKPLTKWKNTWLHKDGQNDYCFTRSFVNEKFAALAGVLDTYSQALEKAGLYDYDDMILRSIKAMSEHDELKFNLQEKYQYILLDEFQDTNAAQFELVRLLSDNPVHEGRPNVMAVGDDDQAIYAFQGARSSNMLDFIDAFRDTTIVNLTKNYRSHPEILHTAHNVASQIESRLHQSLEGVKKTLEAASSELPKQATIERHEFSSPSEEKSWVAEKIAQLVKNGVPADEIAVLAPKHKYLEAIVPFLNHKKIPVTYEKRENILHTPIIIQLRIMSELVLAISTGDKATSNHLFPQVLSMEFFKIPAKNIWSVNWIQSKRDEKRSWAEIAINDDKLADGVWLMLTLAERLPVYTLEKTIDILTGAEGIEVEGIDGTLASPMKEYYFSDDTKQSSSLEYFENLSHLSIIREKLREHQKSQVEQLTLAKFVEFINAYDDADEPMLNTHPLAQAETAVTLQTVYKAKGLEYEHVFLLSCHDDVWGSAARGNTTKLTLPANVQHIRHSGGSEDEKLRLLFVAITRAKEGLYLTSYNSDEAGKKTLPVKYFDEYDADGELISNVLPKRVASVQISAQATLDVAAKGIEMSWNPPRSEITPSLRSLLKSRLEKYQMSPTHLNSFIDLEWGGPEVFLLNTLLKFPQAPGIDGQYGNSVHASLDWYQSEINAGKKPTATSVINFFENDIMTRYIPKDEIKRLIERGRENLGAYMKSKSAEFTAGNLSEVPFSGEGVFVDEAHLTGNIDRLEIDKKNRTVTVVDFKTGSIAGKGSLKYLKYKQQLMFYKVLIEESHSYSGYKVEKGRIEYVEPDEEGNIRTEEIIFKDTEIKELKKLIVSVWKHILELDLPDVSSYKPTVAGAKSFIKDLTN